jgi:hypothetical protein
MGEVAQEKTMSDLYPQSMPCRFEGFPTRIKVVCGQAFSEARATPYSYGSQVILSRTPLSGVLQGTLVVGQSLPTQEIIHSDTGDDATFDLKVAHYGYGRFYLATPGDAFYSLSVIKGVRIEATGINRAFETVDVWDTRIPAASDLDQAGTIPEAVWAQDADSGVTWYTGTAPTGNVAISGRLQLGGLVSIAL